MTEALTTTIKTLAIMILLLADNHNFLLRFLYIRIAPTGTCRENLQWTVWFISTMIIVLVDLDSTPSVCPEELLRNFIIRNAHWNHYIINFEQESGSDSTYALKHWQHVLRDLVKKYGITVKKTQTSHSKYNRAKQTANMIR